MPSPATRRRLLLAGGGTLGLIGLVSAFLLLQDPGDPPVPELSLEAALAEAEAAPSAADPLPAPAETARDGAAKTEPEPPKTSSSPPVRPAPAAAPRPAKAAAPHEAVVASTALGDDGYRLRFASLDDLAALEEARDIQILVELDSGVRYLLPRTIQLRGHHTQQLTRKVSDEEFSRWVAEGRVQRLADDQALRSRLELERLDVRLLAVLDDAVLTAIGDAAASANADARRSLLVLEEGPAVRVALARR